MLARGVPATPAYLSAIESLWVPDRARLAAELQAHGETLESRHWDWQNKSQRQPHWYTLVTVECEGAVQGIMAVENLLRPSRTTPSAWVLYVDYIEAAPWNHRVPQNRSLPAARDPRFKGAGIVLLGEAIRMSVGATAGGRVGLHSLPQAEEFYTRCGMTRVGPDPNYYDLVYFEYADGGRRVPDGNEAFRMNDTQNPKSDVWDYDGCVTAGRATGRPIPPPSEEDLRRLEEAWNDPTFYERWKDDGFVGAGWVPKPADPEARELTVGAPPVSEPLAAPDGVAAFYFDAPNPGRYVLTVRDAPPFHVDVRDPAGHSLLGLEVVGGDVRATVLLAPGRYSVRVARRGGATATVGRAALQVALAP